MREAKELGFAVSIVTNGYYLARRLGVLFLEEYGGFIDWIGMSLDSGRWETERRLGRTCCGENHVETVIRAVENIRRHAPHVKIKINTVVTRLNYREDMHPVIERIRPDRWKVFQVKIIRGVNPEASALAITREMFMEFVERHRDLSPVWEDNELMTGSYIMIDPNGNLVDDADGEYRIVGNLLEKPLHELLRHTGFSIDKYLARKAVYDWEAEEAFPREATVTV